jgi:hypothetical protein
MPEKTKTPEDIAGQFSDDEMGQVKRFGEALGGKPTPFDEEVEAHLSGMEQNAKKMRTAQMGLAPSPMEQAQVKQQGALGQQAATQGAVQAQQAQATQTPIQPPAAPAGPAGATTPYPAQAGEVGPKETPESPASSGAPPAAPGGPQGS